jgi:putative transposase
LLAHRGASRPRTHHRPPELVACEPNRVWCWDITYLRAPVRGTFYYLYLLEDLYSRRVIGWDVLDHESADEEGRLVERTCREHAVDSSKLHLHSDNGGPMKGAMMLATLQRLGVVASFSSPRLSDDNPFPEALFRTLKYRPGFPNRPFRDIQEARSWVSDFVRWYNTEHMHSGLNFVTPDDRYFGRDAAILAARHRVYSRARAKHPERWSGETRNWSPAPAVTLTRPRSSVDDDNLTQLMRQLRSNSPSALVGAVECARRWDHATADLRRYRREITVRARGWASRSSRRRFGIDRIVPT